VKSLEELTQFERHDRALDFVRWGHAVLRSRELSDVTAILQREGASQRLQNIAKAAELMTLEDAIGDIGIVSSGFVSALARQGIFDALLPSMLRIPLARRGIRISTTALAGDNPVEGSAKVVTKLNFTQAVLPRRKSSCIIVVSDELANAASSEATAFLSRELRKGVVAATDSTFLDELASGVSVTASAGGTAANVYADLNSMLAAVPTDSASRLYLIVSPAVAKSLSVKTTTAGDRAFPGVTHQGGEIAGIAVLVSDHLPALGSPDGPCIMLIDASRVAADTEVVTLDIARHASLEMADPTTHGSGIGSPEQSGPANLVSLWATNSRGLRAERWYGFRRLRDSAVAICGGAW
jgi:hypothetical protein